MKRFFCKNVQAWVHWVIWDKLLLQESLKVCLFCFQISVNKVFTFESCVADTHNLLRGVATVTISCKLPQTVGAVRTQTWATVVPWPQHWVAIVTIQTPEREGKSYTGLIKLIWDQIPSLRVSWAHLSQLCPVVWSLQAVQRPVAASQVSVCPLQEQGRQDGKPQWPGRQRSHCRP